MASSWKRSAAMALVAGALVISSGVYAFFAYDIFRVRSTATVDDVTPTRFSMLMACVNGDFVLPLLPWACRQFLVGAPFETEEVNQINRTGSIAQLAFVEPDLARAVLPQLIAQGVDLNVVSDQPVNKSNGWTQLHSAWTLPGWWVELLLAHGAKVDLADAQGKTAVDRLREQIAKRPYDQRLVHLAETLEKALP
jgi:hypothetical protein